MVVETEKPPIIEEENFYFLGKQKVDKSEGAGRTLALLLDVGGRWVGLEEISEVSGWKRTEDEINELQHRVFYYTSQRIEKQKGERKYRLLDKK